MVSSGTSGGSSLRAVGDSSVMTPPSRTTRAASRSTKSVCSCRRYRTSGCARRLRVPRHGRCCCCVLSPGGRSTIAIESPAQPITSRSDGSSTATVAVVPHSASSSGCTRASATSRSCASMNAARRSVLTARAVSAPGCLPAKAVRRCSQMHSAATRLAVAPCAPWPSSTPHARHGSGVPSAPAPSSKNVSWFSSRPPTALHPQLLGTSVPAAGTAFSASRVALGPRRPPRRARFSAGAATGGVSVTTGGGGGGCAGCSARGNRNGASVCCPRRGSCAAAAFALALRAAAVVRAHAASSLLSSSRRRRTPRAGLCSPFSPSSPEQLSSAFGTRILSTVAIVRPSVTQKTSSQPHRKTPEKNLHVNTADVQMKNVL